MKNKIKKPSKMLLLGMSVAEDWTHQNTVAINSRRRVLQFEAEELDKAIVGLAAALANAKERRAKLEAMLNGLAVVISRRGA